MHRIKSKQVYTTCRGGATSVFPETVVVDYQPGSRTVQVYDERQTTRQFDIPVSYFHETAMTERGTRRKTGYYLTSRSEL
ncbi:hypothetical protein [Streptomyces graminilatus]|uniref:hypothetical protein n=1 Tax=Streptomyces graminilatus TaxID=1464070 RepID=UPI0006E134D7|nr:hypothetical protein [Streptomyces graminilatus]